MYFTLGTEGKCCDFNDLLPEDYKDATKTNMQMFHGLAMYCMDALCQVTDFSKYKHIVDLGGKENFWVFRNSEFQILMPRFSDYPKTDSWNTETTIWYPIGR